MASYDADLQAAVDATSVAHDAGTEDDLVQYLRDQLAERDIETADDAWLERMVEGVRGRPQLHDRRRSRTTSCRGANAEPGRRPGP